MCGPTFPVTFSVPEQSGTPPLTTEEPYAITFIYNAQKNICYIFHNNIKHKLPVFLKNSKFIFSFHLLHIFEYENQIFTGKSSCNKRLLCIISQLNIFAQQLFYTKITNKT